MQTITNEQIYDRWEQVPEALKEAFFSTDNGELIWKACEDAGLSEDVIDNVLVVVGNVLLGFTHINDFINELKSIPGMDQQAVDPIIFQIDKRVFEPVKGDILKLYRIMSGEGPKMIAEGGNEQKMVTGDMSPIDLRLSESPAKEGSWAGQEQRLEIRKIKIEEGGEPVVNIQERPIEVSRPELAEFVEGPAIIHEEVALKPVAQKSRPLSSFGGMFGFRKEQPKKGSAIEAQVSVIEGIGRKPEAMMRTEQQPVKVVHYTSAAVPEDMFGQAAQKEPVSPISKQENSFEPVVIDLAEHPMEAQSTASIAQPNHEEMVRPAPPVAIVMKTPQRPEAIDGAAQKESEPRLAEIPVADDAVDLRTLERVENK